MKRSEPYRRIGAIREEASRWQRYRGRPLPGGERRLTASKAPWARDSLVSLGGGVHYSNIHGLLSARAIL